MKPYSLILKNIKNKNTIKYYVYALSEYSNCNLYKGMCWLTQISDLVRLYDRLCDNHYIKYDTSFHHINFYLFVLSDNFQNNSNSLKELRTFFSQTIKNRIKPTPIISNSENLTVLGALNFFHNSFDWENLYGNGFLMWEDNESYLRDKNITQIPFTWQIVRACVGNGNKNFPEQKVDIKNFDSRKKDYELFFTIEIIFLDDNTKEYFYFTVGSNKCFENYLRGYFAEYPEEKIMQPCAWGFYEFYHYELLFEELDTFVGMVAGSSKLEIITKLSTFWDCPNLLSYQPDYPPDTPDLYYFDGNVIIEE